MVKGASGQLLREHTQNCFLVCPFRAVSNMFLSTSPAESRSKEIVPQARMECSQ